jgi:RimJ/RimL family protein N-acetyltransferase
MAHGGCQSAWSGESVRQIPTDLELLRLHIEAVWDLRLPRLVSSDTELLPESQLPPWALYLADVGGRRIRVWRPDVTHAARATVLERAERALAHADTEAGDNGVTREVVLRQTAPPAIDIAMAGRVAGRLDQDDHALLETFDPEDPTYYADPRRAPLIGAVVNGRLVSVAHSSRRIEGACELGVETRPEGRRQGYGLAVTVLWAAAVAAEGAIPIYSARAENTASLALAAAAGYRPFARAAVCEP